MAEEVISVSEDFYILSTSPRVDDRVHVLKHGNTFAIFDRFGDIERFGHGRLGVYHQDTRFLSRFALWVEEDRPLLLSSSIKDDNAILAVDLMNPDFLLADKVVIPRGTVHIFRSKVLWEAILHERIRIHNYGMLPVELDFVIKFDANFADIFEVRGVDRKRRGCRLTTQVTIDTVVLGYQGLDGCIRRTRIVFDPAPSRRPIFRSQSNLVTGQIIIVPLSASQMLALAALTTLRSERPHRERHCYMTRPPNAQSMHLSAHESRRPSSSLRTNSSTIG